MDAKDFIYSRSVELSEAIDNGYDLRLSEPDILYWMEAYAKYSIENIARNNYIFTPEQVGLVQGPLERAVSSLEAIINSKNNT